MKPIKSTVIISMLLYASTSWSSQLGPKKALIEYLTLIQKVKFIEVETKEDSYDLIFRKNYKSLRKIIEPGESRFSRGEGPSHFDVYTEYTVDNIKIEKDIAEFSINYKLVGYILGGSIFCPRIREEKISVKLKLVNDIWKVESIDKHIPFAYYIELSSSIKYFKSQKRHLAQWVINQTSRQLSDLEHVDDKTVYDKKLSYNTILGLLFFDNNFDLGKSTAKSRNNISEFSDNQLRKLRNVIFAKHQYLFKDKGLIKYYKLQFSTNLYSPINKNIELTEIDKNNVGFLKTIEKRRNNKFIGEGNQYDIEKIIDKARNDKMFSIKEESIALYEFLEKYTAAKNLERLKMAILENYRLIDKEAYMESVKGVHKNNIEIINELLKWVRLREAAG